MLPVAHAAEDQPIEIEIRGRRVEAETVATPFYRRKK
jgi:glycine cleavage system aminomethyltransferase T